jgi:hypothetical protein
MSACLEQHFRGAGRGQIGRWGEWSFRMERQRERPWGLGVFRVRWLGITVIVFGRMVLTVTHPVEFVEGSHSQ